MTDATPFRTELLGSDRPSTWRALAVAGGLFVAAAAIPTVVSTVTIADGEIMAYVVVGLGFAACVGHAYFHTTVVESWALVFAPILGALLAFQMYPPTDVSHPVALPFSFAGRGAAELWILTGLFLGSVGFLVGVLARWTGQQLRGGE